MRAFPFGPWLNWAFIVMAGLYVISAAAVLLSRVVYQRRHRWVDRVESVLSNPAGTPADRRKEALGTLSRAPLSAMVRLVADASIPRHIQELLAEALIARLGVEAVRIEATEPRGGSRRWQRIGALRALALARPAQALASLERALGDRDPEVIAATVTLLGHTSERRAAALLVEALTVGRQARSRVATALESVSVDVPELIMPLLSSADPQVRYWGAMLMRRFPEYPGLSFTLGTLTVDSEAQVRKAALETLAVVGGPPALAAARDRLTDRVTFVRAHAARTLGALGAIDAVPQIAPLLADREWWVRAAAKDALQALGPAVVPALVPTLSHPDSFARNGAAEVLQNLGVFEQYLEREATGPTDPQRLQVLRLLAQAGGVRMWDSMLERLGPDARDRARELMGQFIELDRTSGGQAAI